MWILFFLLFCGVASADVYVITAPDKSVYSLSEQDDAVMPDGYSKYVIENKMISDLPVSVGEEKMYDFKNGKLSLNAQKVSDMNKAEQERILQLEQDVLNRASGTAKLVGLGLTEDEVKALLE